MKIRLAVTLTIDRGQEPEVPEQRETDTYTNAERADPPGHTFGFQIGGNS